MKYFFLLGYLLGKFHAGGLVLKGTSDIFIFIFCQENFMKNLLGKFHAEIVMEFS